MKKSQLFSSNKFNPSFTFVTVGLGFVLSNIKYSILVFSKSSVNLLIKPISINILSVTIEALLKFLVLISSIILSNALAPYTKQVA